MLNSFQRFNEQLFVAHLLWPPLLQLMTSKRCHRDVYINCAVLANYTIFTLDRIGFVWVWKSHRIMLSTQNCVLILILDSNHNATISKAIRYTISNYLLKVNNKNIRTRCEICSKLTIFEHVSHFVLVFLLLTLNMQLIASYVSDRFSKRYFLVWTLNGVICMKFGILVT